MMSDTHFMDPEDVKRMCEKSKRLSGAKWKWQKICRKHNLTWQAVEQSYDTIIKRREKMYEKLRGQSDKQLGDAGGEGEVPATGERSDNAPVRVSGPIDGRDPNQTKEDAGAKRKGSEPSGKKVRPGQTEDGTSTTGSTE